MEQRFSLQSFAPDEVPAINDDAPSRWRYSQPEKELLLAVLKDAIATYRKHFLSGNSFFKEAERWFFEEHTERLFSFETICIMLDLSPERMRKDLRTPPVNRALRQKPDNRSSPLPLQSLSFE
jgi:hypothetical protein